MKRVSAVSIAMLVSTQAMAQSEKYESNVQLTPSKENVVYIAPFSLIAGGIVVEYERALTPGASFFVAPMLTLPIGLASVFQTVNVSMFGVGATAGARFYFTGKAPGGLFVGPEVNLNYATATAQTGSQSATASGVGYSLSGTVGYSLVTDGGLALSFGAGVGVGQQAVAVSAGGGTAGGTTGLYVFPSLRAHVGYAF